MKSLKAILFAIGLAWLLTTPAICGGIYDFTHAKVTQDPAQLSIGFVFTVNKDIAVTSLGYFDYDQDGFGSAHTVGIFDDCGNLIASITLSAGTDDALDGNFRYQSITPVLLAAGKTYTLAATTGGGADAFAYGIAGKWLQGLNVSPLISIASDASRFVYQNDSDLLDPASHFRYTLYAGPNFIGSSVPESSSLLLTLAGGALIAVGRVRKR